MTFNTITVSDGISMGTPGMRYSLVSREVIADSIETVVGAQGFDGVVAFGGCDKNMPGLPDGDGAPRPPRGLRLRRAPSGPAPEAQSRHRVRVRGRRRLREGQVSEQQLKFIERTRDSRPGSCAGMYTANTMASAIEAMGMSLPDSSAQDAISDQKRDDCRARAPRWWI